MRIVQFKKKKHTKDDSNALYLGLQLPASKCELVGNKSDMGDIVELSEALLGISGIRTSIDLITNWGKIKEKVER